jgi:ADP-heptose:LPS heptosyltransferase
MESALENVAGGGRVAVIRLRSLGDCVLTTPALHLLKHFRPDLQIAVVVEDRFRAVFEGNPDVETILAPTPAAVRNWRSELCLNLHGGTRSAWMTALSGAQVRAGFGHHSCRWLYHHRIPRAQEILGEERKVHTAEHLATAMFSLGVPKTEIPRARLFADANGSESGVAVIHAVAATPEKTWSAEGFLSVALRLREANVEPIFVGGPGDDLSAFAAFRTLAGAPLGELKSLLSRAALFVGNDSGPAHMAAAFGVPVVVLFGPSDPEIWAPWRTQSEVLTSPSGIHAIEPAAVLGAIERLGVHA